MLTIYLIVLATFAFIALTLAIRPWGVRLGLVDMPNARKQHKGEVPLIGGPILCLMVVLIIWFLSPSFTWGYVLASLALVGLGIADDFNDLPANLKLFIQAAIVSAFLYSSDVVITDIGIAKLEDPNLLAFGFTVFCVMVAINAFNFIDGIDGLAASASLMAVVHLIIADTLFGIGLSPAGKQMLIAVFSCIFAFMIFNMGLIKGGKIFLGDSGSTFLGFSMSLIVIHLTQNSAYFAAHFGNDIQSTLPAPMALWVLAMPFIDFLTVSLRRIMSGHSPMRADRKHLHHILSGKRAGLSKRNTLVCLVAVMLLSFWLGTFLTLQLGNLVSIVGFFVFVPTVYFGLPALVRQWQGK